MRKEPPLILPTYAAFHSTEWEATIITPSTCIKICVCMCVYLTQNILWFCDTFLAIAGKARFVINLYKFAWTDKTTSFLESLMFTKSFSRIKYWSHRSAIAYVYFCSYMKYEVAKEKINYLWLILYSNKEWLNGGTYYFWMHCSLFFPELESLLTKFKLYTLLSPQKEITFLDVTVWITAERPTCHRFLHHSPTNLPYL